MQSGSTVHRTDPNETVQPLYVRTSAYGSVQSVKSLVPKMLFVTGTVFHTGSSRVSSFLSSSSVCTFDDQGRDVSILIAARLLIVYRVWISYRLVSLHVPVFNGFLTLYKRPLSSSLWRFAAAACALHALLSRLAAKTYDTK